MRQSNPTNPGDELRRLSTGQLDELLRKELRKDPVNGATVRLILEILEQREEGQSRPAGSAALAAWEKYRADRDTPVKPGRNRFLRVAAVIVVILTLFLLVPQKADARGLFNRIARWTDSVFELFSPGDTRVRPSEYVFETDHPGLQQVHDTLAELGITEPVVPMWLPEGYELTECEVIKTPPNTHLIATFLNADTSVVLKVSIYLTNAPSIYYKDDTSHSTYEFNGITHSIIRNQDRWVIVWTRDNLECSIFVDCREEDLYRLLRSIYKMEDQ